MEVVGRGIGLDWTTCLSFDTGIQSFLSHEKLKFYLAHRNFFELKLDLQVNEYLDENKLTRSRTNHNVGLRVTYLKCGHDGCPKKIRLVHHLIARDALSRYRVQEVAETAHNHIILPRNRGLTGPQKKVVDNCVERGQSMERLRRHPVVLFDLQHLVNHVRMTCHHDIGNLQRFFGAIFFLNFIFNFILILILILIPIPIFNFVLVLVLVLIFILPRKIEEISDKIFF
jgi:hypothetical protein